MIEAKTHAPKNTLYFHPVAEIPRRYPLGNSNFISLRSDLAMRCAFLSLLFRLVVFFVRIWLAHDFLYTIFPVPVFLKRLAAARLVFILGMNSSP
jgi:hypothetical protein